MTAEPTAAEIVLDHVTKRYGNSARPAIDDLSITIPAGEICVLIGPSGGGKTTAMKMINRLITITEGDILIDGRSVKSLDETELRRGIGYVIQQIGLFPHKTIGENIATVPRLLGWDKRRMRERRSCSRWSSSIPTSPTATRRSYPEASSSGPASRARSRPTRR